MISIIEKEEHIRKDVRRQLNVSLNPIAFEEEAYSPEDIDLAMVKATGHPMGPFLLSDYIGLDVCLEILETLYEETGHDIRYEPPEILKDLVKRGLLGKKTGRGFYEHGKGE